MKVPLTVFLVIFACVGVALGMTTTRKSEKLQAKDEVEIIPHSDDQPIVDTGFGWSQSFGNPFQGLFENLESIMAKMRANLNAVFKNFPTIPGGFGNGTTDFGSSFFEDVDPSQLNKTSVTKIVDGHKIVINDTEVNKDGGFLHIRIIDIKPENDGTSSEITKQSTSVEEIEKDRSIGDNEISKEVGITKGAPEKLTAA